MVPDREHKPMHDGRFLRCYLTPACTLLAALAVLLFSTTPAAAQDTPEEPDKARDVEVRIGVYVSWSSVAAANDGPGWGESMIFSPENDVMPYPNRFLSIRYNNFQATFGWGNDNYDHQHGRYHNEHIARFAARYNFYPAKKIAYIFGGPVLWNFNKEFTFTRYDCTDYLRPGDPGYSYDPYYGSSCKPGAEVPVQLTTDRPDGKTIMFGGNVGFGIEYKWHSIVFSHEMEFYFSGCEYKDFICSGGDFKFLGLHFEF